MGSKPVFLLTGFLGSGKTTLLNQLLQTEQFADTLVIVNEFGEVGLDHLLVETSSDTILELSNGCLCCSVRGELIETLMSLDTTRFEQIIIETTGIADPLPVFQSLSAKPELSAVLHPAAIITALDSLRGLNLMETHGEVRKQLAIADCIFLTKTDLVKEQSSDLIMAVETLNPVANITSKLEDLTPQKLQRRVLVANNANKELQISTNTQRSHHTQFKSMILRTERVLETKVIAGLLHHMCNMFGDELLRIKGFAKVSEHPSLPLVIQVSGPIVHDFQTLAQWPQNHDETILVVISNDIPSSVIQSVFDSFVGNLALDTADRQAIMENPLSVPGVKF